MKFLRFRASTMLLVVALAGVSLGWVVERGRYSNRLDECAERLEQNYESYRNMAITLGAAVQLNRDYASLQRLADNKYDEHQRRQRLLLVLRIFDSVQNRPSSQTVSGAPLIHGQNERRLLLRQAYVSLNALDIKELNELIEAFKSSGIALGDHHVLEDDGSVGVSFNDFFEEVLALQAEESIHEFK